MSGTGKSRTHGADTLKLLLMADLRFGQILLHQFAEALTLSHFIWFQGCKLGAVGYEEGRI
jgi:hypothetical protein